MDDESTPRSVEQLHYELERRRIEESETEWNSMLQVRVSKQLLKQLDDQAKRYGLSRTSYVRELLTAAAADIENHVIAHSDDGPIYPRIDRRELGEN